MRHTRAFPENLRYAAIAAAPCLRNFPIFFTIVPISIR